MKTQRANTVLAIGAALLLSGSALAQQDQQQKPSTTQEKPQMSMDNMMKGCREHCQQTSASIDGLVQTMDEAKQSNDPEKMRAALDQAQKPLAEMKRHMSMCMNMMGMMQKMHGMGGMMGGGMGGMMAGKDAPRMATSPEQLDPVCQMKVDPKTAPQTTYKGTTYYFCSEADKATFLKNPEAYIKK